MSATIAPSPPSIFPDVNIYQLPVRYALTLLHGWLKAPSAGAMQLVGVNYGSWRSRLSDDAFVFLSSLLFFPYVLILLFAVAVRATRSHGNLGNASQP